MKKRRGISIAVFCTFMIILIFFRNSIFAETVKDFLFIFSSFFIIALALLVVKDHISARSK